LPIGRYPKLLNEREELCLTMVASQDHNQSGYSVEDLAIKYGWLNTDGEGYTIDESPSGTYRPVKIICLGAGASGIAMAKLVQDQMENVELKIYDKNADVAGTWLENRYP
jgi:hypothetical protein